MEEISFSVAIDVQGKEGGGCSYIVNTTPPVDSGVFADSLFVEHVLGRDAEAGIYSVSVIADRLLFTPAPGVEERVRKHLRGILGAYAEKYFAALAGAIVKFPDSDLIAQMAEVVFNFVLDEALWGGDDDSSDSERRLPSVEEIEVESGSLLPSGQTSATREDRVSFFHPSPVEVYREDGLFLVGCVEYTHPFFTFITDELVRQVKESLERDFPKFVARRLARRAADRHRGQLTDAAIAIKYRVGDGVVKEELRQIEEREEVEKFAERCRRMVGLGIFPLADPQGALERLEITLVGDLPVDINWGGGSSGIKK